ncbi:MULTISPECIES: alpha/beta hydrolase [unclassified Microcoleus]|uniref:alpha/beta fold hydrolase n=1 Tax=unclassified Microcoleus TaxID=2642155 RepID=UPI001DD63ACF|nr:MULTISPECIES: alpha/beta hydrolase [unclassified Microcoleus]MCC3473329.1 alpha/beta hydrolase [Microcoleus sp. PH2017_13_LAR_U_A]MCC3486505.1 alpha/beta hydrolase [Microcoleus sp. PH2017_14_LAR_D_A]MCC3600199.1 alpha/beta hydrolase [Microcoleus sp. PH2017_26_ELK_O_A]MCC3623146.1 alpha/beta hydrolase [Microcoleus sp. PH2017_36_ELK_O_B]
MSFISVRGVEHYYEWITADNSAQPSGKPVMVFLHGWAGSARYWESTAQAIANDFDCLLYDMRGFGRSPLPPSPPESSYELETYARDLAELLEALNLSRVFLNAHSTGASIATLFLNLYPEKVEKAILTCSGIFEYDEKAFTTFHKFGGYVVKFRPSWLAAIPFVDRIFMARFLRQSLPTAVSLAFLKDFLMADEEAAIGTMVTAVSKRAAEEMPQEFARLSVPTLLVAGEFDQIIPAVMGEQAASLSKKVEFVIIPNTAHFPMLEDAATYLQLIRDFLPAAA